MTTTPQYSWRCLICEKHGLNGLRGWSVHYARYHYEEVDPA